MKKIMMTLAAVAVAATMNAQGYIGGSLGFSSEKTNNGTVGTAATSEKTVTGFNFNPEIGYKLDDKMAVGVVLGFGFDKTKTELVGTAATTAAAAGQEISSEVKTTTFSLKPYLRYQVLTFGKANIFVDGGLNFALESAKDMKPAMDLGLFVQPGVAFDINEKWSIVAKLENMFTLGYHKSAVADVDGAPDPATDFNCRLAAGGFTTGSLRFGVYYNF
jgi:opacity protein-like surface antigen